MLGYQIIIGVGVGSILQNTLIAIQADCEDEEEIPQRTGIVTFAQLIDKFSSLPSERALQV